MHDNQILSNHIYNFVLEHLPKISGNYFEIGVFNGAGVANVGRKITDKIIYAIDPFIEDGFTTNASGKNLGDDMPNQRDACYENINGLDNVVLFECTSESFADTLTDEMILDMNIGCVTIDGSHHYKDVSIDFDLAIRLIGNKSGVIIFDDLAHIGVRQAYYEGILKYLDRIPVIQGEAIIGDGVARALLITKQ